MGAGLLGRVPSIYHGTICYPSARQLKEVPVKISCLARGLPVGSMLGTMDSLTIYKALSERRPF